jgi:hypothetical protein
MKKITLKTFGEVFEVFLDPWIAGFILFGSLIMSAIATFLL